ncbi:concanavalin A-like lectin/glucanase domain-containing protein [Umbelopsis sp. AD052]|nr:concanavalin A-like lectin/glucanase domain-containing protein [Umbelopsis sp. AD052]
MVSFNLSSLIALALTGATFQGASAASIPAYTKRDDATLGVVGNSSAAMPALAKSPPSSSTSCKSFTQNFASNPDMTQYWVDQSDAEGTWDVTSSGLELKVLKPSSGKAGPGATFSTKFLMQYGSIQATLKSAPVDGIVTAFIFMSPGGDEIDYEWVSNEAQSSYFYHGVLDYSTEGKYVVNDDSTAFHDYKITWTEDSIKWFVDGKTIRTVTKESTLHKGVYNFPTEASAVQIGIWDASKVASTAEWAHGPVNWSQEPSTISAVVKSITVTCA